MSALLALKIVKRHVGGNEQKALSLIDELCQCSILRFCSADIKRIARKERERQLVIDMFKKGKSLRQIAQRVGYSYRHVLRIVQPYRVEILAGNHEGKP